MRVVATVVRLTNACGRRAALTCGASLWRMLAAFAVLLSGVSHAALAQRVHTPGAVPTTRELERRVPTTGPATEPLATVEIPAAATVANIPLLRRQIVAIESRRGESDEGGPLGFHAVRVRTYGALMLALARQGDWEPTLLSRAKSAVADAERAAKTDGICMGLENIAEACKLLHRQTDAIDWQSKYVTYSERRQPGEGVGLMDLANLYVDAGRPQDAKSALLVYIGRSIATPDDHLCVAARLAEIGEYDAAVTTLNQGITRFDRLAGESSRRFNGKLVFVRPDNCKDVSRDLWYPLCGPEVVSREEAERRSLAADSHFADVTEQARRYEIAKAAKARDRMRSQAARMLPRIQQERDAKRRLQEPRKRGDIAD